MARQPDRYLGDGIYASYDGYHIILDLRAQEATNPVTRIALEPSVLVQLDAYRKEIVDAINKEREDKDGDKAR